MGGYQDVKLQGNSNEFLTQLMQRTRVQLFEETQPSLHDIFIRIAKPKDAEPAHE